MSEGHSRPLIWNYTLNIPEASLALDRRMVVIALDWGDKSSSGTSRGRQLLSPWAIRARTSFKLRRCMLIRNLTAIVPMTGDEQFAAHVYREDWCELSSAQTALSMRGCNNDDDMSLIMRPRLACRPLPHMTTPQVFTDGKDLAFSSSGGGLSVSRRPGVTMRPSMLWRDIEACGGNRITQKVPTLQSLCVACEDMTMQGVGTRCEPMALQVRVHHSQRI